MPSLSNRDANYNPQPFQTQQDASGNNMTCVSLEKSVPTYRATASAVAPGATPADFLIITGSATKTIKIKRIEWNGGSTAAGYMVAQLIRRSTAATGGTPVVPTVAKMDSGAGAATAVVTHYTAANTPGTGAGTLYSTRITTQVVASTGTPAANQVLFDGRTSGQSITLRGASDFLAVNFAGAALVAGTVWDYVVEWEETND